MVNLVADGNPKGAFPTTLTLFPLSLMS